MIFNFFLPYYYSEMLNEKTEEPFLLHACQTNTCWHAFLRFQTILMGMALIWLLTFYVIIRASLCCQHLTHTHTK